MKKMSKYAIKVSIVVPCYNVEKYVSQCIESICNQTLKDIEIICINDGSKDNTLSILHDFQNKDNRIKIIDKKNTGYGNSVNIGMAKAQGKYIGIVESDDFIEPQMYEELYRAAEFQNLDISRCCYYEYHTSDNSNIKRDFPEVPKNTVFCPLHDDLTPFWQQPTIWINLYRRAWLEENNIKFLETPGASYQDTSFSFKVYSLAKRFMMLDTAYLHYRVDNAESSINSKGKVFCICDEWNEINSFLDSHKDIYEKVKYIVPSVQLRNYIWNYNRLKKENRYSFILVWHKELRKYIKRKQIKWKSFTKKERKLLFCIAYFPIIKKFFNNNI